MTLTCQAILLLVVKVARIIKDIRMTTPLNESLIKGFSILKLFSKERPEISTSVVVQELGMNSATAHRFLVTLEETGALVSRQRGRYSLGLHMVALGRTAELTNPLASIVQPVIDDISTELRESVMACRLNRDGAVCIAAAIANRPITVNISVGEVLELHSSAQGKVWLASMSDEEVRTILKELPLKNFNSNTVTNIDALCDEIRMVRSQGYALNRGEREEDIAAVAVPVKNKDGKTILSFSVFGMVSRFDQELIERAKKQLFIAANKATQAIT
ncbi:MAG: IclR family transcriptional regulator [Sneathiella sp.]